MGKYIISPAMGWAMISDRVSEWEALKRTAQWVIWTPNAILEECKRIEPGSINEIRLSPETAINIFAARCQDFVLDRPPGERIVIDDASQTITVKTFNGFTSYGIQMAVNRAFIRLLLIEMHRRGYEVNVMSDW